jgi:hypothetical protein
MTSKIKVDNIENQCGGAVVTKCGATTTISGSVVKADDIQAADGGNLINQCGTTITLGASGDTINLAAGASQTGFGRTGTVDWDTTAKTASFTAVSGDGYFADTTSSAFTVTLPAAPSAGDIVALSDYTGTWGTNNITVGRNSSNINGAASDLILNTNNTTATLIYVDGTEGWRVINTGSLSEVNGIEFVAATGGTITCCGDFKIHTFTGPGTFTVTSAGNSVGSNSVDYLVVAGGAGGGASSPSGDGSGGAGGGAGGYRESSGTASGCYTRSPLGACVSALPVSITGYPITVGGGGSGSLYCASPNSGTPGSNSVFSTITSTGGGGGGGGASAPNLPAGKPGGSGGGAGNSSGSGTAGTGNTPPVSPPQGNNGGGISPPGTTPAYGSGGGGGATAVGSNGTNTAGGNGGAGATSSINATPTARAGGGGGGIYSGGPGGTGGTGGGGQGGGPGGGGSDGTTNTGGGGGGRSLNNSFSGGSGIVIIRYKFQ